MKVSHYNFVGIKKITYKRKRLVQAVCFDGKMTKVNKYRLIQPIYTECLKWVKYYAR